MDRNKVMHLHEGFVVERLDGEISVYHPTLTTAVYLNETGALIWELCESRRTVEEIVDILGELYPESREQIAIDVETVIARLVERGIGMLR